MTRRTGVIWGISLCFAALLPTAFALLGWFVKLGAHPWWDVKTAVIGAAIGVVVMIAIAVLPVVPRLAIGLAVFFLAATCANYGKAQFAASFAEDAFAGKLWYFGWIGVATGITLIAFEIRTLLQRIF